MLKNRTKKGILLAACAWIIFAGIAAGIYRYIVIPVLKGKPISSTGIDASKAMLGDKPINASDWENLFVVDEISVEPITFGRGRYELSNQSQRILDEAIIALDPFPNYYLVVIGSARNDGLSDITNQLIKDRIESVVSYLEKSGFEKHRIIAVPSRPSGNSGESQAVSFVVGKLSN